jgi:hypothetical protein
MEVSSESAELRVTERTIFVGLSSADRELASQVAQYLSKIHGVIGRCWTDEFPLGLLTFEALERMLRTCAGAVFVVANVDDRGRPNENVMIEVGLVAGRMGRARVALCTYGNVDLPSDLSAVTRIDNLLEMPDPPIHESEKNVPGKSTISTLALGRLQDWVKVMPVCWRESLAPGFCTVTAAIGGSCWSSRNGVAES